jgi:hypothetical protein
MTTAEKNAQRMAKNGDERLAGIIAKRGHT